MEGTVLKKLTMVMVGLLWSGVVSAIYVHWTANIGYVRTYQGGGTDIIITSAREPEPVGSWNCDRNVVHLGEAENPNTTFVAAAMTAFTMGRSIRIGIDENAGVCEAYYITINP